MSNTQGSIVPYGSDPEAMYVCPYFNVHVVRASRMMQHVKKCRRNHGGTGFKICPFNAIHHVPERIFEKHLIECPDKHVVQADIERASGLERHYLPPVEHHPQWNKPESSEDWEAEAEEHHQIIMEQELQEEEEEVNEEPESMILLQERPADWDRMTATQKKNYKRKYNRQQQKIKEMGLTPEDFKKSDNPEDWTEDEREAKIKAILAVYPPPTGKIDSANVDYKSPLNQYCQKNRINAPKFIESHMGSNYGGFSYECRFENMNKVFRSHGTHRTKRSAMQDAARWALLGIAKLPEDEASHLSKPRPIRQMDDLKKMRQAHEVGLLYEAGQLPTANHSPSRPGAAAANQSPARPTAAASHQSPGRPGAAAAQPVLLPPDSFSTATKSMETSMQGLSVQPKENNEWSTVVNKRGRGRGRGTALASF